MEILGYLLDAKILGLWLAKKITFLKIWSKYGDVVA